MASGQTLAAASLGSQLEFFWELPSPAQVADISDCFITQTGWPWAEHRWWLTMVCTTLETPVSTPNGQLQTRSEHHHSAPAQLSLHGRRSLVVRGHSQPLQLTGLGKSLPLTYQQQSRLNYKRWVYSAHTKGTPQVLSLGDRRACAPAPCRTPTTLLDHATKTGNHSSST